MKRFSRPFRILGALAFVIQSSLTLAADPPLKLSAEFDLVQIHQKDSKKTFFQVMNESVKPALDVDYKTKFRVVNRATFRQKASNFDHIGELDGKVSGGADGLDKAIEKLDDEDLLLTQLYGKLRGAITFKNENDSSRATGAITPVVALASGKGVLVRLDEKNYVYNVGYAKGAGAPPWAPKKPKNAQEQALKAKADEIRAQNDLFRKTGRSYGAGPDRNAYDPSDKDYLRDLATFTKDASDLELSQFYTTIFQILLKNDTSGIAKLPSKAQTLISDFMAIYMAELDRHLMTGLTAYEWENAVTELAMLAAFSASDDGVTFSGEGDNASGREWVRSNTFKDKQERERMVAFFGIGTSGTGLDGANKARRHKLTSAIVDAVADLSKSDDAVVSEIEKLLALKQPKTTSKTETGEERVEPGHVDIYDEVMEKINNFNTQEIVQQNADSLIDNLVKFIMSTHRNAKKITEAILQ